LDREVFRAFIIGPVLNFDFVRETRQTWLPHVIVAIALE